MKQINKTILASIAAIALSNNAFANDTIIDKALVEAEIAANLSVIAQEIKLAETTKIEINNTILVAINATKTDKTASTPVAEATAE